MNAWAWTYIVASKHWNLYVGVTSGLENRIWQHKVKAFMGFSSRYNCDRLVYFDTFESIESAIRREKELKGWSRAKKLALIPASNPSLDDLAADWFPQEGIDEVREANRIAHIEAARAMRTRGPSS